MKVGAFELDALIGRGGMGRVFAGRHSASGARVAIKVVDTAADELYRRSFRDEVRAVASLEHPGIVAVLDHGVLEQEVESLAVGAPYLVMELCPHGTLRDVKAAPWPWLRRVLLELLDALAHAHARGVVHRDIKPGNVLRDPRADGRPSIRLTDFGIAHVALVDGPPRHLTTGTPHYMAPEQIEGRWMDHGPWTDLYAVGCLVYRMLTGHPPFWTPRVDSDEVLRRHLLEEAPPLQSPSPVPAAIHDWLRCLLAKRPEDRFVRAADALAALPEGEGDADPLLDRIVSEETETETREASELPTVFTFPLTGPVVAPSRAPTRGTTARAAPLPTDWRARELPPADPTFLGAGIGLRGLRAVPLIGRRTERDALWSALVESHADAVTRVASLSGPPRVGKTALLQWLAHRAGELGAWVLRLDGKRRDAVGQMLGRFLRTRGATRRAAIEPTLWQVRRLGGSVQDAVPLVQLTHPDERGDVGPRVRFRSPEERRQAVVRFVSLLADERAVVLVMDDLAESVEARALVDAIRERDLPVFIAAANAGDLDADVQIALAPLPASDHRALVRRLVGHDGPAVDTIAERSAGEPLLAIHLIGDWLQRGALAVDDEGLSLQGSLAEEDLDALWIRRVRDVVARSGTSLGIEAVELGAALGHEIPAGDWAAAADADVDALGASLQLAGLLERTESGWAFRSDALRVALVEHAGERWPRHHARCAEILTPRFADAEPGIASRLAGHLAESGQHSAALAPALQAARELFAAADYDGAERWLRERERWLDDNAPPVERAEGWLELATIEARRARPREAMAFVTELETLLADVSDERLHARTLYAKGKCLQMEGELAAAARVFEQAIQRFVRIGDLLGQARCAHGLAEMAKQQSRLDDALERFAEAQDAYELAGDTVGYAGALLGEADIHIRRDPIAGRARLQMAVEACETAGHRMGMAIALLFEGLALRGLKDLDGAEAAFLRCAETLDALGSSDAAVARGNIGFLHLLRDDLEAAEPYFAEALRAFQREGRDGYALFSQAELLPCRAAAGDWEGFDAHAEGLEDRFRETGMVDEDLVIVFDMAARLARDAGRDERAAWCERMATMQRGEP